MSNDVFAEHSWYFRNALVRANYNDFNRGIHATTRFLEMFFSNVLMDTKYELKNRYMHVDYKSEMENNKIQSASTENSKCKNCTLDELTILKAIVEKPTVTQKELAAKLQKSERTIKNRMDKLKEKGYIMRVNGKRNGAWKVMIDISEYNTR